MGGGDGNDGDDFDGFEAFAAAPISPGPSPHAGPSADTNPYAHPTGVSPGPSAGVSPGPSTGVSPSASASGRDIVTMGSTQSFDSSHSANHTTNASHLANGDGLIATAATAALPTTMGSSQSFDLLDNPDFAVGQGLGERVDSGLGLGARVDSGLGLAQEDDPDDPFASLHGSLSNGALPSLL